MKCLMSALILMGAIPYRVGQDCRYEILCPDIFREKDLTVKSEKTAIWKQTCNYRRKEPVT